MSWTPLIVPEKRVTTSSRRRGSTSVGRDRALGQRGSTPRSPLGSRQGPRGSPGVGSIAGMTGTALLYLIGRRSNDRSRLGPGHHRGSARAPRPGRGGLMPARPSRLRCRRGRLGNRKLRERRRAGLRRPDRGQRRRRRPAAQPARAGRRPRHPRRPGVRGQPGRGGDGGRGAGRARPGAAARTRPLGREGGARPRRGRRPPRPGRSASACWPTPSCASSGPRIAAAARGVERGASTELVERLRGVAGEGAAAPSTAAGAAVPWKMWEALSPTTTRFVAALYERHPVLADAAEIRVALTSRVKSKNEFDQDLALRVTNHAGWRCDCRIRRPGGDLPGRRRHRRRSRKRRALRPGRRSGGAHRRRHRRSLPRRPDGRSRHALSTATPTTTSSTPSRSGSRTSTPPCALSWRHRPPAACSAARSARARW